MNSLEAAYLRIDWTEGGSTPYQDQVQTVINEGLRLSSEERRGEFEYEPAVMNQVSRRRMIDE
jgi:hypothetical protein